MSEMPRDPELSDPVKEARSYRWEKLTRQQRDAAKRVGEILGGILALPVAREPAYRGPLDQILPPLRQDHWNNVILIDGDRGSGKTSLMASLLQALEMDLRKRSDEDRGFFEESRLPTGRIIPVAFLDLHPLPASTHLLFHLVGRLERVVRALETSSPAHGAADAPAWQKSAATPLPSREGWSILSEVVSTAWEGNLAQRAPNLDTEFYAWEVAKIEKHRLGIAETFRGFVDALCADFGTSMLRSQLGISDPLFLIAVDDVDLVPDRSTEVLDLLRMLWHPRVVFLLTGYSDQLLALLRNDFMGTLLRPLSRLQIADEHGIQEDAASRALPLARSTLDKIIPRAHRCQIERFSDKDKIKILEAELKELEVQGEKLPKLYNYFEKDPYAAKALPDHYRPLRDLRMELSRLAREGDAPHHGQVARAMAGLWRDLLQREPLLLGEERDALREVIRLDENGMLVVDGGAIECIFSGRRTREIALEGRSVALMRSQALMVSLRNTARALPDSINGALKLATNLVADIDEFHFYGESPAPSGFALEPVVIRWTISDAPRSGFTWPLPDWQGFLSTTLFVDEWNEVVSRRSDAPEGESEPSFLARLFLTYVCKLANDRQIDEPAKALEWGDLGKKIKRLAEKGDRPGSTERDRRIQSWALGRAGLIALPEGGLPAFEANQWLKELAGQFAATWDDIRSRLSDERRNQIKKRWEGIAPTRSDVDRILQEIDGKSSDFDWVENGRRAATPQTASLARFVGLGEDSAPQAETT